MKLARRNFLRLTAGDAALPAVSRIASAPVYPMRPVDRLGYWWAVFGPCGVLSVLMSGIATGFTSIAQYGWGAIDSKADHDNFRMTRMPPILTVTADLLGRRQWARKRRTHLQKGWRAYQSNRSMTFVRDFKTSR